MPSAFDNKYLSIIIVFCIADTEGSFVIERVIQVAEATVRHVRSLAQDQSKSVKLIFYMYI